MGFDSIFKVVLNKEYRGAYLEQCSCAWHKAVPFISEDCFLLYILGKQFSKLFSYFSGNNLYTIAILREASLKSLGSYFDCPGLKKIIF